MFCAFIVYGKHTEHQNIIVSSNLGHAIMQEDIREYLHCSERLFQILLCLSSTFIGGLFFLFLFFHYPIFAKYFHYYLVGNVISDFLLETLRAYFMQVHFGR